MEDTAKTEKLISPRKNGGARPGAGRKPKDEKFKQPIAKAEKQIADKLPWLIDKMMELAEGVRVEKYGLTGPVIYQQAPDYKAIAYLVDRIMGKPTERREVTGDDGAPLFPDFEKALQKAYAGDDPTTN